MAEATTKEYLDQVKDDVSEKRLVATNENRGDAAREFALAITHLEDAQMRVTRGVAMMNGVFNEVDLETEHGITRAQNNWLADFKEDGPQTK